MRSYNPNARRIWAFFPSLHRSHVPSQPCFTRTLRFQSSSSNDQPTRHEHFNNKTSPRRRRLKSQAAALKLEIGVDSLGQPGEIVVVPPRRNQTLQQQLRRKDLLAAQKDAPMTISSILEDLDDESSVIAPETIHKRLEETRQTYQPNQKLTVEDWEDLRDTLSASFTTEQLSSYLATLKSDESIPEPDTEHRRPEGYAPLGTSTPWQGTTPTLTGKPMLAERIIREHWEFSLIDEVGHLDLYLSRPIITLLLNADHFSFDQLATLHQSSIDITHALGLVRITGLKAACGSVRDIIQDTTTRIREDDTGIDLAAYSSRLTPTFIDWVCQEYNVMIDQGRSRRSAKVLYLVENKTGADHARRTLGLAVHHPSPTNRLFSTYMPGSEPAHIYSYIPGTSGSWFDRQGSWFRWAMPAVQNVVPALYRTPFFHAHQSRLSDELLKLLRSQPRTRILEDQNNGPVIHESMTATVGQCLFGQKSTLNETAVTASQLGRLSLPRTFVNNIPRMKPFLDTLPEAAPEKDDTETHFIRLVPSPKFAARLPELDVQILSKPGEIELQKIKIILDTNNLDYLLPENGLDLRFTHTRYLELSADTIADSSEYEDLFGSLLRPIRDAFTNEPSSEQDWSSRMDPSSLPPFCQVSLPRNILPSLVSTGSHLPGGEDLSSAEYMFLPFSDVRGTAVRYYDFEGRRFRYRFYDNGPFLASQINEVQLDLELPQVEIESSDSQVEDPSEEQFHSFYQTACNLAFEIHKSRDVYEQD
ncbi:hypothetical protein N7528_000552 [Penicillium herquei]|nr:hypothetical protein N7528_000552 [Penicillium herquei]